MWRIRKSLRLCGRMWDDLNTRWEVFYVVFGQKLFYWRLKVVSRYSAGGPLQVFWLEVTEADGRVSHVTAWDLARAELGVKRRFHWELVERTVLLFSRSSPIWAHQKSFQRRSQEIISPPQVLVLTEGSEHHTDESEVSVVQSAQKGPISEYK